MTNVPDVELAAGDASLWQAAPALRPDRLATSLALHLAILAALMSIGVAYLPAPPAETPIAVDVIGAREFDAMRRPPAAPMIVPGSTGEPLAAARSAPPPQPPAATRQDETIHPSLMLSERALQAPHNRALRRQLASLTDEEHVAQLCDLEAMEQIHLWKPSFQPDRLVDYALSDPRIDGSAFVAKGGAFRSGRQWYEISYHCELDAGRTKVVDFSFRVGDPIPRTEWSALNLPSLH